MRRLVPVLATMLLGAAAVSGVLASAGPSSGVRGRVLYGPTCPVERPGVSCTRPYQTWISARREPRGRLAARVQSSVAGYFTVRLAPGRYVLVAQGGRPFPRAIPQTVTVRPGRETNVTLTVDSGIR
jgi:hypothetical protein